MDPRVYFEELQLADRLSSPSTAIVSSITLIYIGYQILLYFDVPILSPQDILWNALVFITPARLLLDADKRRELQVNNMMSQTHAAKAEVMRRVLSSNMLMQNFSAQSIKRRASIFSTSSEPTTDAPPGLGNWDNSCYQNSVLQGLAALPSLRPYLDRLGTLPSEDSTTTATSLRETVSNLNDARNNGRQLWTPAKLKSMSSWQQQDAQEYFSKVMDELDKEAAKAVAELRGVAGLEDALEKEGTDAEVEIEKDLREALRNPLEGLLAQRVACTQCGFSEGLSTIPFNCLTLSLGPNFAYHIGQCLNEYTKLEEISEVDCAKCTLLRAEKQLQHMAPQQSQSKDDEEAPEVDSKALSLPPEVRALVVKRLQAIQQAIEEDDFADKTLNDTCQIPRKAHVSSTKTKQAVVGRAPQSLAVHVNRSVFDEMTGMQRKNYASVNYPLILDLGPWVMNNNREEVDESPVLNSRGSLLSSIDNYDGPRYRLQAVVTHYGRHENGHYICYRRHATIQSARSDTDGIDGKAPTERWWRLSDEDVSAATEEDVLGQNGVFMLFYEREETPLPPPADVTTPQTVDLINEVGDSPDAEEIASTEETATSSEPDTTYNVSESAFTPPTPVSIDENSQPKPTQPTHAAIDEPAADSIVEHGFHNQAEIPGNEALKQMQKPPTPPFMRTARGRQSSKGEGAFGNAIRQMAAT